MNELQQQVDVEGLYGDVCRIVEQARGGAYRMANVYLTLRNWLVGERIAREDLQGAVRADYGKEVIFTLSEKLTKRYGGGFDFGSIYKYIKFYRLFPNILDAVSPKLKSEFGILDAVSPKSESATTKVAAVRQQLLPWTHYRELIRVDNPEARSWYEQESLREGWSTRVLHRNIGSQCFFLIDLKTHQITHEDVGQMDMYVRMYDKLRRSEGDNPTIGIILCSETSEDMALYSVLNGSNQLFQAKYLTYLPAKEELLREIETQKHIYLLQQETDKTEPTDEPVREPTNEASAETKLVWAMPCKEEEDDSQ